MIQDIDDTFVVKCNCSKQTIIIEFAKKKKNLKSRTDRILKDESKISDESQNVPVTQKSSTTLPSVVKSNLRGVQPRFVHKLMSLISAVPI